MSTVSILYSSIAQDASLTVFISCIGLSAMTVEQVAKGLDVRRQGTVEMLSFKASHHLSASIQSSETSTSIVR